MDESNSTSQSTSTNRSDEQSPPDGDGPPVSETRTVDVRSEDAADTPGQRPVSQELEAALDAAEEEGAVTRMKQYDIGNETEEDIERIAKSSAGGRTVPDDEEEGETAVETTAGNASSSSPATHDDDRPKAQSPPPTPSFDAEEESDPSSSAGAPTVSGHVQKAETTDGEKSRRERLEDIREQFAAGEVSEEQFNTLLDDLIGEDDLADPEPAESSAAAPPTEDVEADPDDDKWMWGERAPDQEHTYRGMRVVLSEPDDDDAFINAQREANRIRQEAGLNDPEADPEDIDGSAAMAANKPLVQLIATLPDLTNPTITDERWNEKMTPIDRFNLTMLVVGFLNRDAGNFTSEPETGQNPQPDS